MRHRLYVPDRTYLGTTRPFSWYHDNTPRCSRETKEDDTMILDKNGNPLVVYERRAIGFLDRTIPTDDREPVNMPNPVGSREAPDRRRGGGGIGPVHEEPFARKTRT